MHYHMLSKEIYNKIIFRQGFTKKVLNNIILKVVITGKLSKERKELSGLLKQQGGE